MTYLHLRDLSAFVGGKWLHRARWLAVLFAFAAYPLQSADAARDAAWPAHWTNPITGKPGGTVTVTADWGVFSLGCKGVSASPEHGYYENTGTRQHLGIDLRARYPRPGVPSGTTRLEQGAPIYSVGTGTMIGAGALWGSVPANGEVVLVEHGSTGAKFTAVYGHISIAKNPQTGVKWKENDTLKSGDLLGWSYPTAGFVPHLHFGIRAGTHRSVDGRADAKVNNDGTCSNSTTLNTTVDPIPYLTQLGSGVSGANACVNVLDRNSAIPKNYGSSTNLFANDRNLLFEAVCRGGDTVEVVAGHNYSEQFTYIDGYHWNGARWVKFQFNGLNRGGDGNQWFRGRASANIPVNSLSKLDRKWFVVYTCWELNGIWKCGCDTPACREKLWQVQGFEFR